MDFWGWGKMGQPRQPEKKAEKKRRVTVFAKKNKSEMSMQRGEVNGPFSKIKARRVGGREGRDTRKRRKSPTPKKRGSR